MCVVGLDPTINPHLPLFLVTPAKTGPAFDAEKSKAGFRLFAGMTTGLSPRMTLL
jgi:hypothetical protein